MFKRYSQLPCIYMFIILMRRKVRTCDCLLLLFILICQRHRDAYKLCKPQVFITGILNLIVIK